ncbi:hypothetical protein N8925_01390 [Candidatus Pelagibacter sp.]|nr:hypothetical protein [Candidatus Pelagibacter sp.]
MKQIVKNFNNLIKKTILNVQNKTNNKLRVSNFNKYLITFISLLFLYLFYLLIPLLYDKDWVQNNIEDKIRDEFKINISTSANISYRILPSPHFLIKDSKILIDNKNKKSIADVKNLKVFFSQKKFFDKDNMILTKLIINNANFSLLRNEIKILSDYSNDQLSNKKIRIDNSNIFFKDNLNEVITIIKVKEATLFYNDKIQLNIFNLKGNVFGALFTFDLKSKNDALKTKEVNFKVKSLKLDIFNESIIEKNNSSSGKIIISFLNNTIKTKYNFMDKLITFSSDSSRLNSLKIDYKGKLSINPFDLDLNIDLGEYKIYNLLNLNSILEEFIKTRLLFNENLSLDLSIQAKTKALDQIFQSAKINFNIVNGKLNLNNSIFVNDKIGLLKLINSNLFAENNELILNTDILIDVKNSVALFSFLNTSKKSRKKIKSILINLDYDFSSNQFKFNKVKIDNNEVSDQFLNIIDDFNDNNSNNLIKSRRLLNKLLSVYEG